MDNAVRKTLKILCPGCQRKLDVTDIAAFSSIHCPVCDQKIVVPQPFANFFLEEIIGSGPTSTVYRGHDQTLDREIAVRILAEPLRQSPETVALFLAQARKNAALVHSAILPIYACGEWQGQPYLTMQFMPSFSLARNWGSSEKPLEMEFCMDAMLATATALERGWTQGILHHSLSPNNILLDEDMNIKVADFGLAYTAWSPSASPADNLRTCCATGSYVSPEKGLTGKQDARGDIYSMGAVFYHLLTGRPPFPAGFGSEEFGRRVGEQIQPPKSVRSDTPDVLSRLIMQMLAVPAESRPQTYAVIQSELETLKRGSKQKRMMGRRKKGLIRNPSAGPVLFTSTGDLGSGNRTSARPLAAPHKHPNPLYTLGILLCIAALVALVVIAGIRRAGWYVRFVEPITVPLTQWLSQRTRQPASQVQEEYALPAAASAGAGLEITAEEGGGESATIALPAPVSPPPETGVQKGPSLSQLSDAVRNARPRPGDLDFFRVETALRAYMRKVPAAQRPAEIARIRELSTMRKYLQQLMRFVPYEDEKRGVVLRNGTVLRGSAIGNDKELIVRQQRGSKHWRVRWDELAVAQYVNFFEFYINMRLTHANPTAGDGSGGDNRKDAAGDAYRVALFCDWYDRPIDAARFARSASSWDPSLGSRIKETLPGAPSGK